MICRALLIVVTWSALAAADAPTRQGGLLFLRPGGKVLVVAGASSHDYDVATGVMTPVLAGRHVEIRPHATAFLTWEDSNRLVEHCHLASTLAETGTFTLDKESRIAGVDGAQVSVFRAGQVRVIDIATCKEVQSLKMTEQELERSALPGGRENRSRDPRVGEGYTFWRAKKPYSAFFNFDKKPHRISLVAPGAPTVFRETPTTLEQVPPKDRIALAEDRLALVDGDRSLFVWDWSAGGSGRTSIAKIADLQWCNQCQLAFRDDHTLVYGPGLIDIATARYTTRPASELRRTTLAKDCELVQARATWEIVGVIGFCGQPLMYGEESWTASEHVAVRQADYHSPQSWGSQVYDLDHARLVFSTPVGTGERPVLARGKRDWLFVVERGWLPLRAGARWIEPDRSFHEDGYVTPYATEDGVFVRRWSDEGKTSVAFWKLDGTKVWDVGVPTHSGERASTVASGTRILVGGGYRDKMRHGGEPPTTLWRCEAGRCSSFGNTTAIEDYLHPWVIERTGKTRQLRNVDTDDVTPLALDDCELFLLAGTGSLACVTQKTISKRTVSGAADGPEIALDTYPSDVRRAGHWLYAYGGQEVRRFDLTSGEVVRLFHAGDGVIATYADDTVEYFGDRASLAPYVQCTKDGKIYVGDQRACRLRESPGRFAKP